MQRRDGKRLSKKATLLKGEEVVLRLEIATNNFGGWQAHLWSNVPGEGVVVYSGHAKGWLHNESGVSDIEELSDAIVRRLREVLPFILV
jgi:hypothetical protein